MMLVPIKGHHRLPNARVIAEACLVCLQEVCAALCEQHVGKSQHNPFLWSQGGLSVSTLYHAQGCLCCLHCYMTSLLDITLDQDGSILYPICTAEE